MDRVEVIEALEDTGRALRDRGTFDPVRVVVGGGLAVMIAGDSAASRVTQDCDVIRVEPEDAREPLAAASRRVAAARGLPRGWLNTEMGIYAHLLPLGWRRRCIPIGTFGPLQLTVISRFDLMGMKLVSAPVRPQDLEDLTNLKPTHDEVEALRGHLTRLAWESLDRESFDAQRMILDRLEVDIDPDS